ncbi:MAG: hypothetical protein ACKVOM_10725 [Ferruginibacter sp.]
MLINRNNYETFFLLYADNELRADERIAVDDFVNENDDLRSELQMILTAILSADELLFDEKEILYKNSFVDAELQEKLILKIDNELPAGEEAILAKALAENEFTLKEYQTLLAAKLNANETILFENKELLYKKEKDNVIVFRIVRWAAAAILIGFGLFFGTTLFKNNGEKINNPVARTKGNNKDIDIPKTNNNIATNSYTKNKEDLINRQDNISKTQNNTRPTVAKIANKETKQKGNNVKAPNYAAGEEIAVIKTTLPVPDQKNILIANNSETAIAALTIKEKVKQALVNENIVPLENTYAQAVSFTEEEKSNNKILYMDEDDLKRSKVGGVFKKLKRFVERTANIKAGNSLKIAGFEIAAQ